MWIFFPQEFGKEKEKVDWKSEREWGFSIMVKENRVKGNLRETG
jgi:hypothetical protein